MEHNTEEQTLEPKPFYTVRKNIKQKCRRKIIATATRLDRFFNNMGELFTRELQKCPENVDYMQVLNSFDAFFRQTLEKENAGNLWMQRYFTLNHDFFKEQYAPLEAAQ